VPTEGLGRDADGNEVGVLLHVVDGYMDDLEFYSPSDVESFGRPTSDSLRTVRWTDRDAHGARKLEDPPTVS
jgi:hypothetical protein